MDTKYNVNKSVDSRNSMRLSGFSKICSLAVLVAGALTGCVQRGMDLGDYVRAIPRDEQAILAYNTEMKNKGIAEGLYDLKSGKIDVDKVKDRLKLESNYKGFFSNFKAIGDTHYFAEAAAKAGEIDRALVNEHQIESLVNRVNHKTEGLNIKNEYALRDFDNVLKWILYKDVGDKNSANEIALKWDSNRKSWVEELSSLESEVEESIFAIESEMKIISDNKSKDKDIVKAKIRLEEAIKGEREATNKLTELNEGLNNSYLSIIPIRYGFDIESILGDDSGSKKFVGVKKSSKNKKVLYFILGGLAVGAGIAIGENNNWFRDDDNRPAGGEGSSGRVFE